MRVDNLRGGPLTARVQKKKRSTRHLGFEVVDPSGRHGSPAIVQEPGHGIAYSWAEVEFVMSSPWDHPKWVFTFKVGQTTKHPDIIGDINTLTIAQPPAPPDVEEVDAWGRGPDSEGDDGWDTETDSDTEDDEVQSRRGRYPSGYPFLQNTLEWRHQRRPLQSVSVC